MSARRRTIGWLLVLAISAWGCRGSEPQTAPAPSDKESDKKPGPRDWQCRPPEGIDPELAQKVVVIRVLVGKDGRPRDVKVEQDPGHGLGQAIRECAMRARYYARDAEGQAIEAWSPPIKVHFTP